MACGVGPKDASSVPDPMTCGWAPIYLPQFFPLSLSLPAFFASLVSVLSLPVLDLPALSPVEKFVEVFEETAEDLQMFESWSLVC